MSESADKQWDFGLGIHKAEGIKEAAVIFEPGEFRRRFRHVEITCQHGQTGASPISHDVADAVDLAIVPAERYAPRTPEAAPRECSVPPVTKYADPPNSYNEASRYT